MGRYIHYPSARRNPNFFIKTKNACRDGISVCDEESPCAHGNRCKRCERRRMIYGSSGAHRFGTHLSLPSKTYLRNWRRENLAPSRHPDPQLVCARKNVVGALLLTGNLALEMMNTRKTHKSYDFARRTLIRAMHDRRCMFGTVKLMEEWTYYLISPLPREGICKDARGLHVAVGRYWMQYQLRHRYCKQPQNFYSAMHHIVPIYLAAAEPYLRLIRPLMAKNIFQLNKRGEDWLNYRGKSVQ